MSGLRVERNDLSKLINVWLRTLNTFIYCENGTTKFAVYLSQKFKESQTKLLN